MKNAILLHGNDDTPDAYWLPYIKKNLEKKGFSVWAPQLPKANDPDLAIQVPFILNHGKFSQNSVIIGHSTGASLILGLLEVIPVKIHQVILVSGFLLNGKPRPEKIVKPEVSYNWEKMKSNVDEIIFINSDNDPWGCNDLQGRAMFNHLGGKLIILHGEGHMGSNLNNQPYKEFPFLLKLIDS